MGQEDARCRLVYVWGRVCCVNVRMCVLMRDVAGAAVCVMCSACDSGAIGVLRGPEGREGGEIGRGVDLCGVV